VLVNTHKGFALEILMTMVHILDEGVSSLSTRLEGVEQVLGITWFSKGSPGTSGFAWRHIGRFFLECDRGRSPSTKK
jgi:hypothetical protein